MAMGVGGAGEYKSDINITPLVDVVLVLLIIFMVITPLLQMGYDVKVPPKVNQPPGLAAAGRPDHRVADRRRTRSTSTRTRSTRRPCRSG